MKKIKPHRLFACCGQYFAVMEDLKGVTITCPSCGKTQRVTLSTPVITIMSK